MSADGIVGSLFLTVDKFSANFVAETYQNIVHDNSEVFYLFATLYVGIIFLYMQRGAISGKDFIYSVFKVVCVLTMTLNYDYFYLYIYNVFTNGPLVICKAITIHGSQASAASIPDALDNFIQGGFGQAIKILSMGGWSNPAYTLFGYAVFGVTLVAVTIAVGLIFLAKIASAILLALSPIFIFFALYDATKGWFDAFIQHLVGYALIPIMSCAVLMIVLSVTNTVLQNANPATPSLKVITPFLIACAVQIWLFAQINTKCASLASGFNLRSFSGSMSDAKNSLKTIANALTGGRPGRSAAASAGRFAGKAGSSLKNFMKNHAAKFKIYK
jgi:type IV secretion system protein VirB6